MRSHKAEKTTNFEYDLKNILFKSHTALTCFAELVLSKLAVTFLVKDDKVAPLIFLVVEE